MARKKKWHTLNIFNLTIEYRLGNRNDKRICSACTSQIIKDLARGYKDGELYSMKHKVPGFWKIAGS